MLFKHWQTHHNPVQGVEVVKKNVTKLKTQIVTKNLKTQIVTKLNSNCDKTKKLKL